MQPRGLKFKEYVMRMCHIKVERIWELNGECSVKRIIYGPIIAVAKKTFIIFLIRFQNRINNYNSSLNKPLGVGLLQIIWLKGYFFGILRR